MTEEAQHAQHVGIADDVECRVNGRVTGKETFEFIGLLLIAIGKGLGAVRSRKGTPCYLRAVAILVNIAVLVFISRRAVFIDRFVSHSRELFV